MTALLPSGHQPAAQPAAWTVATQADGNIRVAIRELRDPAGLQRTLRADGVPVSVTFTGQPNPACQPYPARAVRARDVISRLACTRRAPDTITSGSWSSTPRPFRPALAC